MTMDHRKKWSQNGFSLIIMFEKKNGATDQSGTICQNGTTVEYKMVPLCKVVLKRYLNGGLPVDMKTAIPWVRFGSTFFFQ